MVDHYGKTALAVASYYGRKEVVEYLVSMWGADPFKKATTPANPYSPINPKPPPDRT